MISYHLPGAGVFSCAQSDVSARSHSISSTILNEFLKEEWHHGHDHEWPVWGPVQDAIDSQTEAEHSIKSQDSLLQFLSRFFADPVVRDIETHLISLTESWLGFRYSLRGTYSSYGKGIIWDIVEFLNDMASNCGGGHGASNRPTYASILSSSSGVLRGSGVAENTGNGGNSPGRRNAGGAGGAGGDDSGKDGNGSGSRGGRGRTVVAGRTIFDMYNFGWGTRGFELFRSVSIIDVFVSGWITSEKDPEANRTKKAKRKRKIRERSAHFIREVPYHSALSTGEYDPAKNVTEQPFATLFHATRTSRIKKFQAEGVKPWKTVCQDFSRYPAFYTTNSLRVAYEHVLHQRPGIQRAGQQTGSNRDTVAIMVFRVPTAILYGYESYRDDFYFGTLYFSEEDDTEWRVFCVKNWTMGTKTGGPEPDREFDVVTGAISLPNTDCTGRLVDVIPLEDPNTRYRPQQVVFTSSMSQAWVGSHLVCILREVRSD